MTSRVILLRTNCMTVRTVCFPSWTTARASESPIKFWTMIRRTTTFATSSVASQAALQERGFELQGISTDGSALYPVPIADVFGDVPHQICEFHVLGGVDESRAPRRGKSSQGPGCRTAQAGPGTTFFEAEPTRRSAQEADRAEDSRPVRASLSVRAAPAQPS